MFEDFEFEDKYNPWDVKSLDDFLFYCCPECDHKSITKSVFIKHAVNNHPRSQDVIDSLESKTNLTSITKTENKSHKADERQEMQRIDPTERVTSNKRNEDIEETKPDSDDNFSEEMEIEETKPELTDSSFITKVNHEIIKVEVSSNKIENSSPSTDEFVKSATSSSNEDKDELLEPPLLEQNDFLKPRIKKNKKRALNRHIESVHKNGQYNCDTCDKSFYDKSTLNKHIKSLHEQIRYSCDNCDKIFSQKADLKRHIKSVHEKVRYNCDKCDKSFSYKRTLKEHVESVHDNVRYNCDKCDKNFYRKDYLNEHVKNVHENVRFNCDKCDKSFSKKGYLNTHIKSVHFNSCEKMMSCT